MEANKLFNIPSPLEQLQSEMFKVKELKVYVKRDDLIHSVVSGNKWRKLKLNIERFKNGKYDKLLTFGGAYSNHIAATAGAGELLGIPTIGIIRGDELNEDSNNTLRNANACGMELIFTSRSEYRSRYEKYYHHELRRRHGNVLVVPEGGANFEGVLGCIDVIKEIPEEPDYIITAAGTGTTATGLFLGSNRSKIIVVPVLKGGIFIKDEIIRLLKEGGYDDAIPEVDERIHIQTDYHFGGYGKHNQELLDFIDTVNTEFKLPLDQIYTGKMFYGIIDLIEKDFFESGSTIVALHTGGLQGLSSIKRV